MYMPQTIEIKIPDIGDFKEVAVIEVLVKPGDVIKAEDSIVTLESEKASMDVPAPVAGTVKAVKVKVGDMVAEGPMPPPPVVLMPGPAEFIAASAGGHRSHATPSVRRFARELGVDISKVKGSGPKGRILQQDVQGFVKAVLSGARPAAA